MPFPQLAPLAPDTPDYEHLEQVRFFNLLSNVNHPVRELTFAIPNQAVAKMRSKPMRLRFWREGVRAGVPDIFVAFPSAPFAGLWIEMKRPGEKPTAEQREWHKRLEKAGYCVAVCLSAQEAFNALQDYLNMDAIFF